MNLQDINAALATVNFKHENFIMAAGSIIFNPLFWNILARNEYKRKTMTKLLGDPREACVYFATVIFVLGLLRDLLYFQAVQLDVECPFLTGIGIKIIGYIILVVGIVLVYSSMYKLGITGTYLGDYFGIYMKEPVTSFPFNICENPMYNGSTLNFLGTALVNRSFTGLILTALVFVVYQIALMFEGPFTKRIYANIKKDDKDKKDKSVEDKKDKKVEDKKQKSKKIN